MARRRCGCGPGTIVPCTDCTQMTITVAGFLDATGIGCSGQGAAINGTYVDSSLTTTGGGCCEGGGLSSTFNINEWNPTFYACFSTSRAATITASICDNDGDGDGTIVGTVAVPWRNASGIVVNQIWTFSKSLFTFPSTCAAFDYTMSSPVALPIDGVSQHAADGSSATMRVQLA